MSKYIFLYNNQIKIVRALLRSAICINKKISIVRSLEISTKEEFEDTEYAHLPPFQEHDSEMDNAFKSSGNSKRRLRSCRVSSVEESRQLRSYDEGKQDGGNLSR